MRQVSLNTIALIIFTMTLSVLLGPLIHLPSEIPAIATFCLLGLVTIDTWQLRGQGVTILLDWLGGYSPEKRQRILHHEAGHFLVAYLLNIPIHGYALNAWEAFKQGQKAQGGVRFNDVELTTELQQGKLSTQLLDRYCTVWMAGIMAEKLVYGKAEGGSEDREKLRLLLTQLKRPITEIKIKENWAMLQAKYYLETHKLAYEKLVEAMNEGKSVSDCDQIIQEHLKPEKP
jgi:hypothetical protein